MPPRSEVPGSASQPPIDRRVCAELGAELSRVRVSRGLSLTDVGRDLLLSNRQVQALERVDFSVFYSVSFFLVALRKYAKLCGLDPARVDAAAPSPSALAPVEPPLAPIARPVQQAADPAPQPPGRLALVALVLAVGLGAVAGGYALWQRVLPPATAVAALPLLPPPAPPVSVAAAVATPSITSVASTEAPVASPEPGSAAGVGTLPPST
jgi:cytoskeletal protein RodZ